MQLLEWGKFEKPFRMLLECYLNTKASNIFLINKPILLTNSSNSSIRKLKTQKSLKVVDLLENWHYFVDWFVLIPNYVRISRATYIVLVTFIVIYLTNNYYYDNKCNQGLNLYSVYYKEESIQYLCTYVILTFTSLCKKANSPLFPGNILIGSFSS